MNVSLNIVNASIKTVDLASYHLQLSNKANVTVMNMNDLYLAIVFSFIYVVGTMGVMTILLLYQEEIDNVQSLSVNQLSDFNLQKLLKMYAKFVFFIFFLSIFYRLVMLYK